MNSYHLPCGCQIERGSERVLERCAACTAAEANDRHAASVEERRVAREKLWASERAAVPA